MHQKECVLYGDGDSDDEGVASVRRQNRHSVIDSEEEESSCSGEEEEEEDCSEEEEDCSEEDDQDFSDDEDLSDEEQVSDSGTSDTEDESDDEGEEESGNEAADPAPDSTAGGAMEISEGEEGETCAICLGYMRGEVGSPEGCDHCFCLECILEWSKTNNSCPQDRLQFLLVFARKKVGGRIFKRIPITEAKPQDIPEEEEEPTFCEVCGRCDREDRLLLCDGCDLGFHLDCLTPPLSTVPVDQWFCPECQALNASHEAATEEEIEAGELDALIEDSAISTSAPTTSRRRTTRLLPRTRASERVRAIIHRTRQQRIQTHIPQEALINEEEEESEDVTSTPGPSRSSSTARTGPPARKRRKTVRKKRKVRKRKRKTTTKRKTSSTTKVKTKVKTTTKTTSATKVKRRKRSTVTKRRKRKVRRKKRRKTVKKSCKIPKPALTPKARIAETLGIRPTKPWQMTPDMRGSSVSSSAVARERMRASLPRLTLLGTNSELDYNSEPDEYGDAILAAGVRRRTVASTQALARRKGLSARALLSHAPLVQSRKRKLIEFNNNSTAGGVGILDNIIENQSILHSSQVEIGRDRQLVKKTTRSRGDRQESRQEPSDVVNGVSRTDSNSSSRTTESSHQDTSRTGSSGGLSVGNDVRNSRPGSSSYGNTDPDPTGAKAYSSYLQQSSCEDSSVHKNTSKKKSSKSKDNSDEDVDIYSDIEPEDREEGAQETVERDYPEDDNKGGADTSQGGEQHVSDNEDLVIDDNAQGETKETSREEAGDNVVGSSSLSNLNDFDLEAVSDTDTDTHDMDKSMNSSISLSDSNNGDEEVSSSTTKVLHRDETNKLVEEIFGADDNQESSHRQPLGLEGLEMETISDNEEIEFDENEDNIEEGEIPGDRPRHQQPLSFNRSKISIQLPRAIAVSPPPAFDGEYEEGEIIDENARREKKKEKIRKEKESFQEMLEETKAEEIEESSAVAVAAATAAAQIINREVGHILEQPVPVAPVIQEEQILPKEQPTLPPAQEEEHHHALTPPPSDKKKQPEKEKSSKATKDKKDKDGKDVSFKKVSKNTKERNYRESGKDPRARDNKRSGRSRERSKDRDRGRGRDRRSHERRRSDSGRRRDRDRDRDRDYNKKEPKRKELERYDVRKMINKKEEERKKKDEFGRDVALRELRTRSRSRQRRRSHSKSPQGRRKRSGSRSTSRSRMRRKGGRRRRSYSSSSSSSTTTTSTSSSYTSSSSSTSRSPSRSRGRGKIGRKARSNKSRSRSPMKKKIIKKKLPIKNKDRMKDKNIKKTDTSGDKRRDGKKGKDDKKRDGPGDRRVSEKKDSGAGERRKKRREKSPLQSKEVYQAGGSIMVSVNFSRKEKRKERNDIPPKPPLAPPPPKRRKEGLEGAPMGGAPSFRSWSRSRSGSPNGKRTPLQDEPMWSPGHRTGEGGVKTPEVIDLDIIMLTPPPQEPILISDSEEETPGITRLPPDLGAVPSSPPIRTQGGGPKTPPEPGVKFTLSTKQVLKPINNPLRDEEEEERPTVTARGPNTPPGPPPESDESIGRNKSPPPVRLPHSPAGTPPASSPEADVYDPFEPTKSPSPQRSPPQEQRVSSSDQTEPVEKSPHSSDNQIKSKAAPSTPPPLPTEPPTPEERPPEPQKPPPPEEEATSTVPAVATPTTKSKAPGIAQPPAVQTTAPPAITAIPATTAPPPVIPAVTQAAPANQMHQLFAGLPTNVANILYPAAIAAAVRNASNPMFRPSQTVMQPDFSRPPPGINRLPSALNSGTKIDKTKATQNGQSDVIDMDLDSPNSPDSSDVSDMFEPPSPQPHAGDNNKKSKSHKSHSSKPSAGKDNKFDALFGGSHGHSKRGIHKPASGRKSGKSHKKKPSKKFDEEDIPSSAVDMQVKDKFLKKVQRQERVVDEVKLSLKPFYNKKTISKTEYKEIMRKCVQKVCHNKTGEINPTKIRSLVEGYIKKVKYYHKKQLGLGVSNSTSTSAPLFPTVNNPPAPGSLITKGPLPPMPIKNKA